MATTKFKAGAPAPSPLPYRSEEEVMSTWQSRGTPLVSICCATYNHADFLEDALHGFLGQVTSFPFEIIVRDDASTDGTTDIVMGYAARFPNIIRPVVEKENQHSKGIRANPALLPLASGEFIALCEGDDYWVTPDKLEKQVHLLHANPKASMSVARTAVYKSENGNLVCASLIMGNEKYLQYFDDIKKTYFHTSTYLIRTDVYREVLSKYANKIEYGDTALRYMLVDIGPLVLLKEVVSVYRVTGRGIWTSLDEPRQIAWEMRMTEGFYKYFDIKYRHHFGMRLFSLYCHMIKHDAFSFQIVSLVSRLPRFMYLLNRYGVSYFMNRATRRMRFLLKN